MTKSNERILLSRDAVTKFSSLPVHEKREIAAQLSGLRHLQSQGLISYKDEDGNKISFMIFRTYMSEYLTSPDTTSMRALTRGGLINIEDIREAMSRYPEDNAGLRFFWCYDGTKIFLAYNGCEDHDDDTPSVGEKFFTSTGNFNTITAENLQTYLLPELPGRNSSVDKLIDSDLPALRLRTGLFTADRGLLGGQPLLKKTYAFISNENLSRLISQTTAPAIAFFIGYDFAASVNRIRLMFSSIEVTETETDPENRLYIFENEDEGSYAQFFERTYP